MADVEMKDASAPATPAEEKWYPRFDLAQLRANYERNKTPAVMARIMEIVKQEKMLPYYLQMCDTLGVPQDIALVRKLTKKMIDFGYAQLKKGGDWERRNKLKVYDGLYKIQTRDFRGAVLLLLLDAKRTDAEENYGDIEVKNAMLEKADFLNQIGDKDQALEAYEDADEKTVGIGGKLDNTLTRVRIGLFWDDLALTKKMIDFHFDRNP